MVKLKFTEGFFIGIALLYIFIRFKSIQKTFYYIFSIRNFFVVL